MRSRYLLVAPSLFLLAWATPARAVPEFDGLFQTVALHDDVHGMALGDLDGDGKQDLIVALEEDLAVLHGSGDGTFGVETDYATGGSLAQDVALADFNGDGRLDVVCVDTTGALSLFLNDGAGGLLAPANYPSGTPLVSVIAGDFNGDGHADVAACGAFNAVVWLWTAPGVLGGPALLPVHVPANDIVIGDFDADGKPDLVLACGSVSVFKGNGNGTFGPELAMGSVGRGRYVAVGDLNGDIYPDVLLTIGGSSGGAIIFLNNGGAGLTQINAFGAAVRSPAAWIADFNGDGLADVMASGTFTMNVWLRSGPGTFGTFLRSQSGNHWQGQSALGDLNGDGKLDVVVENYPNIIDVHLGNGDGSFGSKRSYNSGSSNGVLAGDFNGDGHPDVFVTNGTVFPGSGHGDLGAPITTSGISFSYDSQVAADFDRDGKLDVAGVQGNAIVIEKGVGNGTFTLGTSLPGLAALTEGDWNGDGIPDLVAGETGNLSAYLGHGDLTFDHFTTAAPGQTLGRPRIGDFNGDGKADVACENVGALNNIVSIFMGHGDGSFDGPVSIPVSSAGVVGNLAVGDLNGDGRSDMVASTDLSFPPDTLWVLLNQGDGTFQRTSYPQIPETLLSEFLIGDFNGDGYPDLAAGDAWFDAIGIFPGNGHGALGPPSYYGFSHRIFSLAAGDFDEDGALDLLAINPEARFVSVLLHSPPQAVPALFSATRAAALADRVEVSWYTTLDPGATVSISRTDSYGAWRPVGSTIVDGAHSITFVDRDITPGAHYGYAVSANGPLSGDVWVDVPSRAALAFLGAQPNPARGALTLAIRLASAHPAVIEVFSVDGRRLLLQKISGEEAGEHLIRLGRALPAGVHIVRLTQGTRSVTGRIAVLQ